MQEEENNNLNCTVFLISLYSCECSPENWRGDTRE